MFTFFMTNLLRTIYTKCNQNWRGFVEDMTKNILVFFFSSQCRLCLKLPIVGDINNTICQEIPSINDLMWKDLSMFYAI